MSKKKQRERNRLEALLDQIAVGEAFCKRHDCYITIDEAYNKRCYTGSHGRKWCKYYERR